MSNRNKQHTMARNDVHHLAECVLDTLAADVHPWECKRTFSSGAEMAADYTQGSSKVTVHLHIHLNLDAEGARVSLRLAANVAADALAQLSSFSEAAVNLERSLNRTLGAIRVEL